MATERQREKLGHEAPAQDTIVAVQTNDLGAHYWEGRTRNVNEQLAGLDTLVELGQRPKAA